LSDGIADCFKCKEFKKGKRAIQKRKDVCPNKTNRWVTIKGWGGKNANGAWQFIEMGHGVDEYPAELRIKTKYIKEGK